MCHLNKIQSFATFKLRFKNLCTITFQIRVMPPLFKSANRALKISEPHVLDKNSFSTHRNTVWEFIRLFCKICFAGIWSREACLQIVYVWMHGAERMAAAALNPNSWSINQAVARVFASRPRKHAHTSAYTSARSWARRVCFCDENAAAGKNDSVLSDAEWSGRGKILMRERPTEKHYRNFLSRYLRKCTHKRSFFLNAKSHFGWWWRGRFICALAIHSLMISLSDPRAVLV